MLKARVTGADKIRIHLANGYAISHGVAHDITGHQTGDRTLRRIIEANPSKYSYVWIVCVTGDYKAFFETKRKVLALQVNQVTDVENGKTGYVFLAEVKPNIFKMTKPEKSKAKLMKQIKQCEEK